MTVYARLLGPRLHDLPPALRALHQDYGRWSGRISVEAASNPVLRRAARLAGLPRPVTEARFEFQTEAAQGHDIWQRQIGGHRSRSKLWAANGLLVEQMGPARAASELVLENGALQLKLHHLRLLGLPIPRRLALQVNTCESADGERYCFDIRLHMPLTDSLLIRYHGHLQTGPTPAP